MPRDAASRIAASLEAWDRADHGTRTRYVRGCRCDECRAANTAYCNDRRRQRAELEDDVTPSGPPIPDTLVRGGHEHAVLRCPGVDGEPCVRTPATWLKSRRVCRLCAARATIWNGLVPAAKARAHLLALRELGVGILAVSDAADVTRTTLVRLLRGDDAQIRASTERRILAVDEGARADHSLVDGADTRRLIKAMRKRGFTLSHLGRLLGGTSVTQIGVRSRILAASAQRIERLWQRIERGEIVPERALVDAAAEYSWLASMRERGMPRWYLEERLGVGLHSGRYMSPERRDAVRALRDELDLAPGKLREIIAVLRRQRRPGKRR